MTSVSSPLVNGAGRLRASNGKVETPSKVNGFGNTKQAGSALIDALLSAEMAYLQQKLASSPGDKSQQDINGLLQILSRFHEQNHDATHKLSGVNMRKLLLDMLKSIPSPDADTDHHVNPENKQPASKSSDPSPAQPLLLTSLGNGIIASSDEPVGAATGSFSLPSAKAVLASPSQSGIVSVDSTAPQFDSHAATWQQMIKSARSGAPFSINGIVLGDPSIVTNDTAGNTIKVPLSAAFDAPSDTIPIDQRITSAAKQLQGLSIPASAHFTVASISPDVEAVIPQVLVANNLAGNEATTVPPGFIVAGNIKLFGGIEAELFTSQSNGDKSQMVVINKSPISLDELLPQQGFSFGNIVLQHPTITLLSKSAPSGRDMGLWLDATVSMTGAFAGVDDVLADVFAKSIPSIDISVHLGGYQSLSDLYKAPTDLLFKASLVGLDAKIGKFLELTSAEVEIHGTRPSGQYQWTVALTGSGLLTVPGSATPLKTSYTISKAQATYELDLKLTNDQWDDAMGVPGFHLQNVLLNSSFTKQTKDAAFTFDIKATFALGATAVDVNGSYSGEQWSFTATVGDFNLQQLEDAFAKLFNANLVPINHNVVFTGLSLDANSTNKRLELKGGVLVDGYSSATAVLDIGPTGVHLTGDMNDVSFDKATLTKAHLELVIVKSGLIDPNPATPGISAAFTILGTVQVNSDVSIDAEVSFAKSATAGLVWVVYAKATLNFTLSKFIHNLPADLDLKLENVVVMASNTDDGSAFPAHSFDYKVKKGFQLYAKIDCPQALANAIHSNPASLILELDLGSVQQEVEFIFGVEQTLALKPGMVAPSIKAGIMLTANPQIFVEADMAAQLSGQPGPLVFALRMQVGPTEAQASASLTTDWINPFNISPKVKVLAPVSLGVIIDYAAVTYPSGVSFQGGLQVGNTTLHAAFEVGQNPEDGVLLVHAENLGIRDIVSFASLVIEKELPLPPSDILVFKDLYLGLSSGGTIASVFYPPGVTFNADVLVFGKEVKVHCAVDKKLPGFSLQAEVDSFQLGPLSVTGDKTKNPTLDLEFGTKLQHLLVDGKIALFDSDIAINLQADLVKTSIDFDAELKFTDMLLFTIQAHAAGQFTSFKDAIKGDFSLSADFEQKLLDYMIATANTYIAAAKKAADEGLDSANAKLTQAQAAFNDHLAQCQRDVNHAQAVFQKKKDDVTAIVNSKVQAIQDEKKSKQAAVDQAQKAYNDKITSMEASLQQAKNNGAAKIKSAQDAVTKAKQDGDAAIKNAQERLDAATSDMTHRFGDANKKLQDAKNDVASKQSYVNDVQNRLNNINGWRHPLDKTRLEIELRSAQAALGLATVALTAAQTVLMSGAYKAAQGVMSAAEGSLVAARSAADASLNSANFALTQTTNAANASISAAQQALDSAKTASQELHVFQIAKSALDTFLAGEAAALKAANSLLDELATCAEKVAFDAATTALNIAKSATKELDAAKAVVNEVKSSFDELTAFGQWMLNKTKNIFNVQSVRLSGSLNGAATKQPFTAHIKGTFADAAVDVTAEFYPGKAEDFVKGLVMRFIDDAKKDLKKYVKL